jgi:hypothetical protein
VKTCYPSGSVRTVDWESRQSVLIIATECCKNPSTAGVSKRPFHNFHIFRILLSQDRAPAPASFIVPSKWRCIYNETHPPCTLRPWRRRHHVPPKRLNITQNRTDQRPMSWININSEQSWKVKSVNIFTLLLLLRFQLLSTNWHFLEQAEAKYK